MKKIRIDDLKKDHLFEVPKGYFDELPGMIQSKVATPPTKEESWSIIPMLKWSPVVASVLAVIIYFSFFNSGQTNENADTLLAQVNIDELVSYIEYSEINTEELIASIDLETMDLEGMESEDVLFEELNLEDLESIEVYEEIDLSSEI